MRSKNQADQMSKPNLYLILGIAALCFLIGGITIWFQSTSHRSPIGNSSYSTPQINLPITEYPTIPPSAPAFTVSIHNLSLSGITGKVTFKDIAGKPFYYILTARQRKKKKVSYL